MYLVPFFVVEPDLAAEETRSVILFDLHDGVPAGSYGLIESYCPDPDCDCRRVMINVAEKKHPARYLASISYGFDREAEGAGPYLDLLNEQCAYAESLMRLVERVALNDRRYVARLKRHYAMVKRAAADPGHPACGKLQEAYEGDWLTDVDRKSPPQSIRSARKRKPRRAKSKRRPKRKKRRRR